MNSGQGRQPSGDGVPPLGDAGVGLGRNTGFWPRDAGWRGAERVRSCGAPTGRAGLVTGRYGLRRRSFASASSAPSSDPARRAASPPAFRPLFSATPWASVAASFSLAANASSYAPCSALSLQTKSAPTMYIRGTPQRRRRISPLYPPPPGVPPSLGGNLHVVRHQTSAELALWTTSGLSGARSRVVACSTNYVPGSGPCSRMPTGIPVRFVRGRLSQSRS